MKGTLMEVILAGVILSSGCATMTRATRLGEAVPTVVEGS